MEGFIKNKDFIDWTDNPPDDWSKGDINPENSKNFYNVSFRRIYEFKILGIRFSIKGKELILKR